MNLSELYGFLRRSHMLAQSVVDTVNAPLIVLDPQLRVLTANDRFYQAFGLEPERTVGRPLYRLGDGQWDIPDLRRLLEEIIPRSTAIDGYEIEHDVAALGRRTMRLGAQRLKGVEGSEAAILLSIEDVTEASRMSGRQELLIRDLQHRIRNLLSLVSALARQTRAEGSGAEAYRADFLGRLRALEVAQNLVLATAEDEADLGELLDRVLAPYTQSREKAVAVRGCPVRLSRSKAVSFAMVLHELATNAVKYGALSADDGRVEIAWEVVDAGSPPRVRFSWQEAGGPRIGAPPSRAGFGMRMLEQAAAYELGGVPELRFAPPGLTCRMEFASDGVPSAPAQTLHAG
jgi:two-component sensor histidine kinase